MILTLLLILSSLALSKELVLVSVYPFYDVVKGVSGDRITVEVLVPPGADYHHYDLSPSDVLRIEKARAIFLSGAPLGGWELKVERFAGDRAYKLASAGDPHLWMSPKRMISVAKRVFDVLSHIDPKGREEYIKNLRAVIGKLEKLHRLYADTLGRCKIKVLPTAHPVFGWLAKDYGLSQLSIGGGEDHGHGGIFPGELLHFVKELMRERINFIFSLYGYPSKAEKLLREEYGVKVYEINARIIPSGEGEDYFSIMEENLRVLGSALRCT
ncbi:MAG TPA: zinc ABC transporter substrate-binding protein [Aquifex aeolicus]|nr:zinc ABC transporter substrate-binding protein [Aquifex aeolicus]